MVFTPWMKAANQCCLKRTKGPFVMTLQNEIIKILLDKLAIGILLLLAGFLINKSLEKFRATRALMNDLDKQRFATQLQLIERQLSEFYWPIYLRLQKDNVVWRRILDKKKENNDPLQKIGVEIEANFILPNHDEIVKIIETKIHLARLDEELLQPLLAYIKHVAVYKAARAAGHSDLFPIHFQEPWPAIFFPTIEKRTKELQKEYDKLLVFYKDA
jgi:hypothetical protein